MVKSLALAAPEQCLCQSITAARLRGGNGGSTGYYGIKSLAMQTGDLTGSWYEIGLGANLGIAKNSNLYFDALKTFNSTVRTDWQFNAGLRFTF